MLKVLILLAIIFIVCFLVYKFIVKQVRKEGKSTLTDEELDKFFDPRYNK